MLVLLGCHEHWLRLWLLRVRHRGRGRLAERGGGDLGHVSQEGRGRLYQGGQPGEGKGFL